MPTPPDQPSPFLDHIVVALAPFVSTADDNEETTRAAILDMLRAYGAQTPAELLHAALIIAFSLSALDTLARAQSNEMSDSLRLRYQTCANALNRAARQNTAALQKSLSCDTPPTRPHHPADDMTDEDIQTLLHTFQQQVTATPNRLKPASRPPYASAKPGIRPDSALAHLFAATA